ncbi:MAG: MBL fold metallo-hydrolase [bacterium]
MKIFQLIFKSALIFTFVFTLSIAFGQENDKWFTAKLVAEKVWCIDDHGSDNMYLVEGTERALLIDVGTGVADLKSFVESLTKLPVIVVNTHGHPDHAGNNFQFENVYAHPDDFQLIAQFTSKDFRNQMVQQAINNSPDLESLLIKDADSFDTSKLIPIKEGFVFDIGERKFEVIETPGHTPGSICLIDSANKLIFTGDNNNTLVWLFLDGCLPLELYMNTLQKEQKRSSEFDTIFPGHGEPIEASFINDQIICIQQILSGECEGTLYKSFAGDAKQCSYNRATVAYNPENLFRKQ